MLTKKLIFKKILVGVFLSGLIVFGCAMLQQLTQIQKPSVEVDRIRFQGINFESASLALELKITNPNRISVPVAGFDYDLQIEGTSFLKGQEAKQQVIQSMGESKLEVPVTIRFKELYQTYKTLKEKDSTDYQIALGISVDLPAVGKTRIPLSKSGRLPLYKIPSIRLNALKMKKFNITGADLEVELGIQNPNAFSFLIDGLDYEFSVGGLSWASGAMKEPVRMKGKSGNSMVLPVSLDFLKMGQTVYKLLLKNQPLDYRLKGNFLFESPSMLSEKVNLPVDLTGKTNWSK